MKYNRIRSVKQIRRITEDNYIFTDNSVSMRTPEFDKWLAETHAPKEGDYFVTTEWANGDGDPVCHCVAAELWQFLQPLIPGTAFIDQLVGE